MVDVAGEDDDRRRRAAPFAMAEHLDLAGCIRLHPDGGVVSSYVTEDGPEDEVGHRLDSRSIERNEE
jgi:hypothetical protein